MGDALRFLGQIFKNILSLGFQKRKAEESPIQNLGVSMENWMALLIAIIGSSWVGPTIRDVINDKKRKRDPENA